MSDSFEHADSYEGLVARLQAVTRERDEARHERDVARVMVAALAPSEAGAWKDAWEQQQAITATLERECEMLERMEMAERGRALRLEVDVANLRALLREVEWAAGGLLAQCWWCHHEREIGHATTCKLKASLEG